MSRTKRMRSHLSSWVMLSPSAQPPYTPLPNERTVFASPPRIGFALTTPAHFPGKQQTPFTLHHASGTLYLTNRRLIYLPDKSTPSLQSFAAPILNLHDSHVTAPFFGPNVWMALLQPTPGGGIPVPAAGVVEIRLTFKEGGAFDFHTQFERVKERLQQAVEVGRMQQDGDGSAQTVGMGDAGLDELPAYQERSEAPLVSPVSSVSPPLRQAQQARLSMPNPATRTSGEAQPDGGSEALRQTKPPSQMVEPPSEPPPGYEEVQRQGVAEEVRRRASGGDGR